MFVLVYNITILLFTYLIFKKSPYSPNPYVFVHITSQTLVLQQSSMEVDNGCEQLSTKYPIVTIRNIGIALA